MADNLTAKANTGSGTDILATDEIGGVHFPRAKIVWGVNGVAVDASATDPLPVTISGSFTTELGSTSLTALENITVGGEVELGATSLAALESITTTGPLTDVQLRASAVPVSAASLPLPTDAATETTLAEINGKFTVSSTVPDNLASGVNTRLIGQDTWTCSFADSGASLISSDFTTPITGTGVSFSQVSGALAVVAGTSTNAEFLTRTLQSWRSTMMLRHSIVASQRIVNTNFAVILADLIGEGLACTINSATSITVTVTAHGLTAANVGQSMFVGGIVGAAGVPGRYAIASVPTANTITLTVAGWPASGSCTLTLFGRTHVKHIYTGATATSVSVDSQRKGWASGDTAATINTTASPGHLLQCNIGAREIYWADTLRASTVTPTVTTRASRYENIPDDNTDLHVFLWSYNGTTAPASSTTWTIGFVSVERFANLPVTIQTNELQGQAAPMPATLTGTSIVQLVTGSVITPAPATAAGGFTTYSSIVSAASTNATVVKGSAGTIGSIFVHNTTAAVNYLKVFNKATAPTVGTDTPVMNIAIPANAAVDFVNASGWRFTTGIGIAITGGQALLDATAVAAGDVTFNMAYV